MILTQGSVCGLRGDYGAVAQGVGNVSVDLSCLEGLRCNCGLEAFEVRMVDLLHGAYARLQADPADVVASVRPKMEMEVARIRGLLVGGETEFEGVVDGRGCGCLG